MKKFLDKKAICFGILTALMMNSIVLWHDVFSFLYSNEKLPFWMVEVNRSMVIWQNELHLILWPSAWILWTLDALEKKRETMVYIIGVVYALLFSGILENSLKVLFQLDSSIYFHRGFHITSLAPPLVCVLFGIVILYFRRTSDYEAGKIRHKALWAAVAVGCLSILFYTRMLISFGIKSRMMYHVNSFYQYGWIPLMILAAAFFSWKNKNPIIETAAAAIALFIVTIGVVGFADKSMVDPVEKRQFYLIVEQGIRYSPVLLTIVLGKLSMMRNNRILAAIGWAGAVLVIFLLIGADFFDLFISLGLGKPFGAVLLVGWTALYSICQLNKNRN